MNEKKTNDNTSRKNHVQRPRKGVATGRKPDKNRMETGVNHDARSSGVRISGDTIAHVVAEIKAYQSGTRPGRLTWAALEEISGHSRQALSARPALKRLYDMAVEAGRQRGHQAPDESESPPPPTVPSEPTESRDEGATDSDAFIPSIRRWGISLEEYAERIGISLQLARDEVTRGRIKVIPHGRRQIVPMSWIREVWGDVEF